MFFLKEKSHPIPTIRNIPSKSRSERNSIIQMPLGIRSYKKEGKRTLITFFLKEKSHPIRIIRNIPSKSRSKRNSMVQRLLGTRSYKKEGKRMLIIFVFKENPSHPHHSKHTFQESIQKKFHNSNAPRNPFLQKRREKNVNNVLS